MIIEDKIFMLMGRLYTEREILLEQIATLQQQIKELQVTNSK
jgi:hypothetical protein